MARSSPLRPLLIAACGVWLLSAGGCSRAPAQAAASPGDAAPLVSVVVAAPDAAADSLHLAGLVGYKRETPLSFDASGTVSMISVDIGDNVRAGQVLARLRRATVGTNASEAALARETAERQLARVQALYSQGFASQAALDDARLAVERARDTSELRAPSAGVVLRRAAEPAQTVTAGQPVVMIGEPAYGIIVRASASSADAAKLVVGQRARIVVGSGEPRNGTVARIAVKSDDATGAFEVEIAIDAAQDLRGGQVATVLVDRAGGEEVAALTVPTLALLDARADQGVVYVVDAQNTAHRRTVQTGGLAGERVIVLG